MQFTETSVMELPFEKGGEKRNGAAPDSRMLLDGLEIACTIVNRSAGGLLVEIRGAWFDSISRDHEGAGVKVRQDHECAGGMEFHGTLIRIFEDGNRKVAAVAALTSGIPGLA